MNYVCHQGWGAGAGAACFWPLGAGTELLEKKQEQEPLQNKSGSGAAPVPSPRKSKALGNCIFVTLLLR